MVTALPPEDYIYTGVWTNYVRGGKTFGTTLTVSPGVAAVLSPALALIISIAGSQLWRLFQFALHQTRATQQEKNFLFHQQQITLRNTATDLNTLWRLIRLAFAWRRHTDVKAFSESFPLLLWTTFHLVVIILFGIFSSWLLQAHEDVLSRSPWCGQYSQDFIDTVYSGEYTLANISIPYTYSNYKNSRFAVAQQHLDVCATSFEGCDVLMTNALPYNRTIAPGTCPFPDSICHPNVSAIEFDTGYLSSARHLGLNAPVQDRVSFRMQAQCAPLNDARFVTPWQSIAATPDMPAHQSSDAHYGPGNNEPRNATFSYANPILECEQQAYMLPYELSAQFCHAGGTLSNGTGTFDPIPQLQSTDADTSLIMLMSQTHYTTPITDPWFSAQLAVNGSSNCEGSEIIYSREIPLTTIGCTQKWQICNTDSPATTTGVQCTPLQGLFQNEDLLGSSTKFAESYNPQQLATIDWITRVAQTSSFYYYIVALAQTTGPPIKARNLVTLNMGISMPDNQWQIEVEYWMQGLLAYIQQASIDSSTGQFALDTKYINVTTPKTDATGSAYRLCQNQIIHSTAYRNFNFFAMLLCIILCAVITVLGLTIEDIIGYIQQQRSESINYRSKKDMWFINSDLEMLRTITELKKKVRWSRSSFGIPFAPVGAKAVLDDLKNNDDKESIELKHASYGRRRTNPTAMPSHDQWRVHGYGVHQHKKSCATCESFELVSSASDSSLPRAPPDDQQQQFHYMNALPSQVLTPKQPHLRTSDHSTLLDTHTQERPGVQPLQNNVTGQSSSFNYSNNIPSSNDLSINGAHEQGMSMLVSNESNVSADRTYVNWRSRSNYATNITPATPDLEEDEQGRSWLWSKKKDTSGIIC